jgi:hypothetical protein
VSYGYNTKRKAENMGYRTKCEEELLELARQYARMKLHGAHVENGQMVFHCTTDAEDQAKYLGEGLLRQAEKLILGMSVDEVDGELKP